MADAERVDLDAVTALCDAATPGPWLDQYDTEMGYWDIEAVNGSCVADRLNQEDAELTSEARRLLPALVAEVADLRAKVDAVRKLHDRPHVCTDDEWDTTLGDKVYLDGDVCPTLAALGGVAGRDDTEEGT